MVDALTESDGRVGEGRKGGFSIDFCGFFNSDSMSAGPARGEQSQSRQPGRGAKSPPLAYEVIEAATITVTGGRPLDGGAGLRVSLVG